MPVPAPNHVSVIVGSLRQKSWSRRVARAIEGLAPPGLEFSFVEIGDLPHYNEDLEAAPPQAWTRFRGAIAASTAVLFVTPEFNRGMPGVLKNSVDVGSRPWGKGVWASKPAAVVGVSPGALGAFGSSNQLRQVLAGVGAAAMPHPEAYISNVAAYFDAGGELVDDKTKAFLSGFVAAFKSWIERHATSSTPA
jgi:chromate reductase, NAD(P)H dehydrogenase (quinone)